MNLKVKEKILAIIYRKNGQKTEFLALRNNPHDPTHGGDFYFVVTGGIEENESFQGAVRREITEETGIKNILKIIDLNKICEYTCAGEPGFLCREAEFLVEVGSDVSALSEEHIEYKWLEREDFVGLIGWNDKNDLNFILDTLREEYDIKYYSLEKAENRESYFSNRPLFSKEGIDSNKVFFDYILDSINSLKKKNKKIKILDLGTGTGYVPQVLCALSKENFEIVGVDLAEEMIKVAEKKRNDNRIKYCIADNKKIPFKNESFDIVTNKLSTRFDPNEVRRILKKGGIFVFKEYGKYKGFKEIAGMFKDRYKKTYKDASDYARELSDLDFELVTINFYRINRVYSLNEIGEIFSMADLIRKFNKDDLIRIGEKLMKDGKIEIISDPFILFAKK